MGIFIKNDEQIDKMRKAGKIVARTHETLEKYIKPGITTLELNEIAEDFIRSRGAEPSFLGYRDYPAAICVSVNDQVIHGIPDARRLVAGDIVSVDIGVYKERYHSDAARTHPVGEIGGVLAKLIEATAECFFNAMPFAKNGRHLHEMSAAIERHANECGFTVVQEWCGHGIGRQVHEDPQIPNHKMATRGPMLKRGMTLAVEPMVNEGGSEVETLENGWTIVTLD
ncbi:MAG: type I methionyl aminopeptidase, partial [Defluviitaleaceae bacterium]|nr:type I methionyl aminopeptidase [Defluviitaleaceae bacterium]